MTAFPWKAMASPVTVTITLNSLATANRARASALWDNRTTRWTSAAAVLKLGSFNATASLPLVHVWLMPAFDGDEQDSATSYPPVATAGTLGDVFQISPGSSAKVSWAMFPPPRVLPIQYRIMVENQTGATFAGSGNSLEMTGTKLETEA